MPLPPSGEERAAQSVWRKRVGRERCLLHMRFITALDRDVIITVRDPQDRAHPSLRVLVQA